MTGLISIADISSSDICSCPSSFTLASILNNSCGALDTTLCLMRKNDVSRREKTAFIDFLCHI